MPSTCMSNRMNAVRTHVLTVCLALLALTQPASAAPLTLDALLARSEAPHGVVFEIVDRDPEALNVALPWVKQAAH